MKVAKILEAKGSTVYTASPEHTIESIVNVLAEKRIGSVVLTNPAGGLAGVVSERDVVRALATDGADALAKPVSAYMTRNVVTGLLSETVDEIMDRMTAGKFRHVPIMENGKLVGMVSIGDVVKYRIAVVEAEASAMREYIATA